MFKFIKELFSSKDTFEGTFADYEAKENKFLEKNVDKAIEKIKADGWKILSTDTRLYHYSFKIKKGSVIGNIYENPELLK